MEQYVVDVSLKRRAYASPISKERTGYYVGTVIMTG
jgi:hypothetical protein